MAQETSTLRDAIKDTVSDGAWELTAPIDEIVDAILALLRERLLSDEAVEAMARAAAQAEMPWVARYGGPMVFHTKVLNAYRAGIDAALDEIGYVDGDQ